MNTAPPNVVRKALSALITTSVPEEANEPPGTDARDFPKHIHQQEVRRKDQAHHRPQEKHHHEVVLLLGIILLDVAKRVDE